MSIVRKSLLMSSKDFLGEFLFASVTGSTTAANLENENRPNRYRTSLADAVR